MFIKLNRFFCEFKGRKKLKSTIKFSWKYFPPWNRISASDSKISILQHRCAQSISDGSEQREHFGSLSIQIFFH